MITFFNNPDNVTNFGDLIDYTNSITEYYFAPMILLSLYLIIVIITVGKTEKQSSPFVISGLITSIIAILFRAGSWINDTWLFGILILTITSFTWNYFENK